jgi:ABC-type glycerol-3-phosphate transport system permease component
MSDKNSIVSRLSGIVQSREPYGTRLDVLAAIVAKALVVGYGIAFLFPIYYLFVGATTTTEELLKFPPKLLPGGALVDNVNHLIYNTTFLENFASSLIFALGSAVGVVLVSGPAGYALAKFDFKGRRLFMITILVFMAVPFQMLSIPLYNILQDLSLLDTYAGVILPTIAAPIGAFFIKQNLEQAINDNLLRSARVDGASEIRIFFEVVMPLAKPGFLALFVYVFIWRMKAYYWPLIVLKSPGKEVVQVFISSNSGGALEPPNFELVLPAALLVTIPVLIVFLVANDYFVKGLTAGSKR